MTERRVTGLRRALVAPLFRRALALAALLATALAASASLATEASLAAGCDAQSMLAEPGAAGTTGAACVAPDLERDQAYLVETARPGATMLHQGLALAIVRLHPMFVRRLAEAIGEARGLGLPSAGIFSAYRPPAFGVGGFSDKFSSLHTYGLAVDLLGVGGPGSSEAKHWYEIASRHAIVCPYGAGNRREMESLPVHRREVDHGRRPVARHGFAAGPHRSRSDVRDGRCPGRRNRCRCRGARVAGGG
jgi:hypothetical protein